MDLGIAGIEDAAPLGSGGFGTVYRARQPQLNREVAVKVLSASALDERGTLRFEREAAALGALSAHPHIVTVHDVGRTRGGEPYFIMELLTRGSLSDRLRHDGPVPWDEALEVLVALASALETAHRAGILHRDLKPENVLVGDFGEPRLADFGIARVEGQPETASASVSGTLAHLAPELLEGASPSVRSDLYSLGSTLHHLLSGAPPLVRAGDSLASAYRRVLDGEAPDLREHGVPDDVATLVEGLIARDPDERPASAADVARQANAVRESHGLPVLPLLVRDDLTAAATTERDLVVAGATTVTPTPQRSATADGADATTVPSRAPRRSRLVPTVVVLVLVAVVATVALAVTGGGEPTATGPEPDATTPASEATTPDPDTTPTDDTAPRASTGAACDLLARPDAPAGGDGSAAAPFAGPDDLLAALTPGQTGCLAAGEYAGILTVTAQVGGTPEAPVTLAAEEGAAVTLVGGLEVRDDAHDLVLHGLSLRGDKVPLLRVFGDRVTIAASDITNPRGTCAYVGDATSGVAEDVTFVGNRFHDCGIDSDDDQNRRAISSGASNQLVVRDNVFTAPAGFAGVTEGVLFYPDGDNALIEDNTFVDIARPVSLGGDDTGVSTNNVVSGNIMSGARGFFVKAAFDGTSAEGTTNNLVTGNCLWSPEGAVIDGKFTATDNVEEQPTFVDAAGGDHRLSEGSACQGYGAGLG